ncbi:hypothetical protein ACFU5I_16465, partial [Streptomyces libani]
MQPAEAPVAGPLRDQHRIFDFSEAAKSALLDAVSTPELLRTGRHIGHRLEQLAGRSPDFPAWLAHPDGMDHLPAGSRAFSSVERRLMARLGASVQVAPPDDDMEPAGTDGWRPLTSRDPRRLGPYTLHGRQPGARSLVYLGRDRAGKEAAVRVIRPGAPEEAAAMLTTEAEALGRMAGQYAPVLLATGPRDDPPWLAMQLYRPSGQDQGGPPPQLSSLLRAATGSQLRRDTLLSIAYGWHLASAVNLCHLKGLVLPELTPQSVHVVGRSLMLTGLGRCGIDGNFRARGAEAVPTMADNIESLGQILRRLGDKHRVPQSAESGDMALWQGDTWRPLREIVTACLSEDPGRRPTAGEVAETFARYVPMVTELRTGGADSGSAAGTGSAARFSFRPGPQIPLDHDSAELGEAADRPLRGGGPVPRLGRRRKGPEQQRKLELVRARLRFSYRATVVGVDGDVGRSTVTIALGALLSAARGGRVIALDAGHAVGELAGRLNLGGSAGLRHDLLRTLPAADSYEEVLRHTLDGPSGLRALTHGLGRTTPVPVYEEEYRRLMELLSRHFSVVLADWAHLRTESVTDTALSMTHRLVVVAPMTERGIEQTQTLLSLLARRGHPELAERAVLAVTGLAGPDRPVRRDDVVEHFRGHPGGVVFIPFDYRLDSQRDIELARLRSRTQDAFLDLAALLAEDFPGHTP